MKEHIKIVLIFSFILSFISHNINSQCSFIYVHLGNTLPLYIFDSISQTRLFNTNTPIFVVCNRINVRLIEYKLNRTINVKVVAAESLHVTQDHQKFLKETSFNKLFKFSNERFFYIQQVMSKYNLKNVFHLENDNLIYINVQKHLSLFVNNYRSIGVTFDNDHRCIPGFVYIKNILGIKKLNRLISHFARTDIDMYIFGKFRNKYPNLIDNLPIVPKDYSSFYELKNLKGEKSNYPRKYSQNVQQFDSIFDAAAIGQYLAGVDPLAAKHQKPGFKIDPGFINESCLFNARRFSYEWKIDQKGRKVPYLKFKNKLFRINNLHIHSKKLKKFMS